MAYDQLPDGRWVVETVPLSVTCISPAGVPSCLYFVKWMNFSLADGTWECRRNLGQSVIGDDLHRLEQQNQEDGEAELRGIHTSTIEQLQAEMQRVLLKREGQGVLDHGVTAFVRMHQLTAKRLFGDRLDYLARVGRSGRPGCRTWTFSSTTNFYYVLFPHTRLRRVVCATNGRRRIIAVTARVSAPGTPIPQGEEVVVLTDKMVYYSVTSSSVVNLSFFFPPCDRRRFRRGAGGCRAWARAHSSLSLIFSVAPLTLTCWAVVAATDVHCPNALSLVHCPCMRPCTRVAPPPRRPQ